MARACPYAESGNGGVARRGGLNLFSSTPSWAPYRNGPGSNDERCRQMVPTAVLAHLDDIHRYLGVLSGQPRDVGQRARRAARLSKLGGKRVVDEAQRFAAANRAVGLRRRTVVLRGAQQVGVRVADIEAGN